MKLTSTAAILGLVALAVGPLPAALIPLASFDAAQAENSKGNGNSGNPGDSSVSHGNSATALAANSGNPGQSAKAIASTGANGNGALASELKGLNAVKANPNALDHAAPNSQVGRIAAYRDAAQITVSAKADLAAAETALAGLEVPVRGVDAIDAEIAALDPNAAGYDDALAALQAERANAEAYAEAVAAVDLATEQLGTAGETEEAALLTASGGRPLSDEAIAYIRSILKL